MRGVIALAVMVMLAATASAALAYQLKKPSNNTPCTADGSPCNVYCDDGNLAGTMYWNGSVWTDGVKWDSDEAAEARKIVAANGTSCT